MRRDQRRERLAVSAEVWWVKLRHRVGFIFQLLAIGVVIFGGYVALSKSSIAIHMYAPMSQTLPPEVVSHPLVIYPSGNAAIIGAGLVLFWLSS